MDVQDRIIHQIYEAAEDPEAWMPAAQAISDFIGGGSVHLLLASLANGDEYVNLFASGDPSFAEAYLHEYADIDFRVPRVMTRPLAVFTDEREYVTTEDARRSPIHQELLPRYDVHNISGSNMSLASCIGWFGVSTPHNDDEFDQHQLSSLNRISAHLLRALSITKTHHDLKIAGRISNRAADFVNVPIFTFLNDELINTNLAAQNLIAGGFFAVRGGRLWCTSSIENAKFQLILQQRDNPSASGSYQIRNLEDGSTYVIRHHELSCQADAKPGSGGGGWRAVTIVETNLSANPDLDEVRRFCGEFGVTEAEVQVLHSVFNFISLRELADRKGIRLDTAQQQLKSAMAKMDLNSQKRLFQAFERFRIV
jgi:DNA-binding CsgD family transcriptional regulator